MKKRTAIVFGMTACSFLALAFAWGADRYGNEPILTSPPALAYFVVFGGFSIVFLLLSIFLALRIPPRKRR